MRVTQHSYGERKTDKEKSHKGNWWWECPGSVLGINSGRPRHTRDVWADLCGNSHSRGRMSAGQTGQMTGQMGHVHGTDGTYTRGCPAKIFYVYWFFFPQSFPLRSENSRRLWLSEILCRKSFPADFDTAGKFFTAK